MAKNLGGAVIELLAAERVELRYAAALVLAAVGADDKAVVAALTERLADPDAAVRGVAFDAIAAADARGIAPKLVPLLDDEQLAERAAALLAQQGADAESALKKALGSGAFELGTAAGAAARSTSVELSLAARRAIAKLLLERGTQPAIEAVLDQLADAELGEQALQLVRAAFDAGNEKLGDQVEKIATARAAEAAKALHRAWSRAQKAATDAAKATGAAKTTGAAKKAKQPAPGAAAEPPADPLRDPEVAAGVAQLGALLRLVGYLARASTQSLLLKYASPDEPRPIRLAAIAGLRRIVAQSEARGTERIVEQLIDFAGGDDPAVAQSAVDTLRGARIPEALAKAFAQLAKSKNAPAQKLAMERLPAGGGASAVKALVEALGGADPTVRDAAARGLAKAPEAVLPLVRALLETAEEHVARRYAGAIRSHRGNVSKQATDELVERLRELSEKSGKGKANAEQILLERVIGELVADVAPHKHVELLFERARRLRKAGKPVEAFGSLKPLVRSRADLDAAIDDDQRFFLALLSLEVAGEGIASRTHADDPVFAQFSVLAAKGYPVAKQLAKASDVTDEALYGLGFRLIESGDASNEELGAELLQGIIDERPRSKLAKAAKNKLKLSGYADN